jgi:hypothetical protein
VTTTIDIAAGELRLRFERDAEGKLRQIGFRVIPEDAIPEEGSPIERGPFPPEAFPLACPAWARRRALPPRCGSTGMTAGPAAT